MNAQDTPDKGEKLGAFPYVIAGLSYIPLIGVIFGLVAIVWGFATKKGGGRKLAFIGGGGIMFTVVLYSAFFYVGFFQRGGVYDDLRSQLAQSTITSLVQAIEFHKVQHGRYPETLEVLRQSLPENSTVFVFDPTDVKFGGQPRYFHYELVGTDHYFLLGVGPDGAPFTDDDIVPEVDVQQSSSIGLLKYEENGF
jgi:hypothetical protein